jgi:proteic killer suppression protein
MTYSILDGVAQHATLVDMIISFKHKGLERFFRKGSPGGIQAKHKKKLRMQLAALDTAQVIDDMDIPGYRLHPLKGNRKGAWSITVNGNWQLTFEFKNGNVHILNYEDYH